MNLAAAVDVTDLGVDVATEARRYAGRKVFRLLERMSIPPFVVAHRLVRAVEGNIVPDLALVVVSGWEPGVPDDLGRHADDTESRMHLIAKMQELITPTRWLSGLPNNALCQIAITTGSLGPNMHLVGGGAAVAEALGLASDMLHRGSVPAALVVAFDSEEPRVRGPNEVDSSAAGIVIVSDGAGAALNIPAVGAVRDLRAVDALSLVIGDACRSEQ